MGLQEVVTGLVLSSTPVGENDKRVVILTLDRGKISAFARGARRPKSPLLACTEPFTFGVFRLYTGRDSYTLSTVEVQNYFTELRENIEDIYTGMYFCEVADFFTRENLEARDMLKLLYQSLRALHAPGIDRALVEIIFEYKMVVLNGEGMNVMRCGNCGDNKELVYLSRQGNCAICKSCFDKLKSGHGGQNSNLVYGCRVISPTAIYTLQYISTTRVEKLFSFTVTEEVREELESIVSEYFYRVTGKECQIKSFLDGLMKKDFNI